MRELIFEVTQEADGGFIAECLTDSIVTEADTWDQLRHNVKEVVRAFLFRSTGQASHHHSLALSERRGSCIRMKLPRDLAGRALVKVLCRDWGYRVVHQEGSHIILDTEEPSHQRIPIPDHNPIRIGTLNTILRLVSRHKGVERDEILRSL